MEQISHGPYGAADAKTRVSPQLVDRPDLCLCLMRCVSVTRVSILRFYQSFFFFYGSIARDAITFILKQRSPASKRIEFPGLRMPEIGMPIMQRPTHLLTCKIYYTNLRSEQILTSRLSTAIVFNIRSAQSSLHGSFFYLGNGIGITLQHGIDAKNTKRRGRDGKGKIFCQRVKPLLLPCQ